MTIKELFCLLLINFQLNVKVNTFCFSRFGGINFDCILLMSASAADILYDNKSIKNISYF